MQKLYVYVDETGQDTKGRFFLVAIVITERGVKESIRRRLETIEKESGRRLYKWRSTKFEHKKKYLKQVANIRELKKAIFYAVFKNTTDYLDLTGTTISKAILLKKKGEFQVIVIIDGLSKAGRWFVSRKLRDLGVTRKKVKGARFRSDPFIRLADALAGFLRDYEERQSYAKKLFRYLSQSILIKKIK